MIKTLNKLEIEETYHDKGPYKKNPQPANIPW